MIKKFNTFVNDSVNIGLPLARREMPQVGASASFVKYLMQNDVSSKLQNIDGKEYKSSQMEFDDDKVQGLRTNPSKNPIIVSNDGHVLDGHHRWLADKAENRPSTAYVCDLPILDLLYHAKNYSKQISEEITRKELAPMLDSFVSFASDKLGLKSMPNVRYKSDEDYYNSFAAYNPSSNELSISTANRHPMDIFRSVAHELVHHKQNEDGRLGKDIEKEGATGSKIENEANLEAGKIMRWFAKANPDMFKKSYVVETNTAAMYSVNGIRGLGNVTGEVSPEGVSQYVLDNQSHTKEIQNSISGLWYDDGVRSYWLDQKGTNEYKVKATKSFKKLRESLNEGINDPGKLKAIFLAGGPGSGKDYVMNSVLAGQGLREVNSDTAFEYLMKKHGLDMEMPDEERLERDIVRGRAKNITKEKERLALAGRLGLIINGTADDVEKIKTIKRNLEADGYETMMVFVNTSNEVSKQRNVDRGKGGGRKVPDGTDKQGVPNGTEDIRSEKWQLAQKNIGELQKVFGNSNFAVLDNSIDVRKASPEVKEKVLNNFNRVRRMSQQFVRSENQNPAAKAWVGKETQKRGITNYQEPKSSKTLTQIRQSAIPNVIHKPDNELMIQARRLGLSYYGFGRFGRKVNGINKVLFHSQGGKLVRVQQMNEEKKTAPKGVCWKGYEMVGMKKKGGRKVPNCVPVEEEKGPCWKGYEMVGMKKKGARQVPNCVPANEAFENFVSEAKRRPQSGWERIAAAMKKQGVDLDAKAEEARKAREELMKTPEYTKLKQEALTAPEPWGYNFGGDGIGPTYPVPRTGTPYGFGYSGSYSSGISESIVNWMNAEKTQQKFAEKYGDLWEEKLLETALKLEDAGCGCMHSKEKKSLKKLREGTEGNANMMGTVPVQRKGDQEVDEQSILEKKPKGYVNKFITTQLDRSRVPQYERERIRKQQVAQEYHPDRMLPGMHEDWQKVNRNDKTDGMSPKAVAAYRRENPGSKLKTAVTEKNPSGKRKNRKASFCARMSNVRGPTSKNGELTPKGAALKRWRCEE